jgi:hypothetical protein
MLHTFLVQRHGVVSTFGRDKPSVAPPEVSADQRRPLNIAFLCLWNGPPHLSGVGYDVGA